MNSGGIATKGYTPDRTLLERLAAYEDSGLTPERVQELADAEREGRLAVLPWDVGTTIYRIVKRPEHEKVRSGRGGKGGFAVCPGGEYVIRGRLNWTDSGATGKTVFLTRAEAEAALKERVNKNE